MRKCCGLVFLLALTVAALPLIDCGSNSSMTNARQLQNITIHSTVTGTQIEFTASGTFSAAPVTVSPIAVSWSYAPPPPDYTLTAQPFTLSCLNPQSPGPIVAVAPADPNAPVTGSMSSTSMVTATGPIPCPP